jgi:hypothetical protein
MRRLHALSAALLVALLVPLSARAADVGAAAKASAPYYAALVASARGNIDATSRQLLLLSARWDAAVREARSAGPPELTRDPAWGAALDRATAMLAKARELARVRDIAGAHAELEEMRLVLHEIRERHGAWTFDDHLAEYHEMVERVSGHVSGRSEINFTQRDYQDVDEDLRGAQASWASVEKSVGAIGSVAAWQQAARETSSALQATARAIVAKDRAGVAIAAERLKSSYFDLLTAVAKARS